MLTRDLLAVANFLVYIYIPNNPELGLYIYSYILQANEQNIKISIKQTQTQPQYSMPHGRRRVVLLFYRSRLISDIMSSLE